MAKRNNDREVYCDRTWRLSNVVRLGYSHDLILDGGVPYLERRVVWLLWITLRWHTFLGPDPGEHLHDHPWWFVTLPLSPYYELVEYREHHIHDSRYLPLRRWPSTGPRLSSHRVAPWRLHFRPAEYLHRINALSKAPVHSLVVSGPLKRVWGFCVRGRFVNFRDYGAESFEDTN